MRVLLALFMAIAIAWPGSTARAEAPLEPLTIVTSTGTHTFEVEFVDTPETRARGLMFREALAPDTGMLFDFERPHELTFWMRNTPLSLDIIFISADGRVVRIARKTTPYSEKLIKSGAPARAALEVEAGTADRIGLAVGDRIDHRIFATAPAPRGP